LEESFKELHMPIYEYECPDCGRFEVIQKVEEAQRVAAVNCKTDGCSQLATRLMSTSAFHLKGSGWYKTDYASGKNSALSSGNATKSAGNDKESSAGNSDSLAKSEASSEVKSDAQSAKACGTGCGCH
jgi:putative FmdB family regulatory protein